MAMVKQSLSFRVPGAAWKLLLTAECMAFLRRHAQTSHWKLEVVGQLYSRDLTTAVVSVDAVTKLPSNWASYTGVTYDRQVATVERSSMFNKGLHCVGFWHSHPEEIPRPSGADLRMAADHALAARDVFAGLVFVIVGTARFPEGLGIWLHDGNKAWEMNAEL